MLKQLVLSALLIVSIVPTAHAEALTYRQIDALDVQDDLLAKLNNKYFLLPRYKKIDLIYKTCSMLQDGTSIPSLIKSAQSVDADIDWNIFVRMTLVSAIEGGWCGEFKQDMDAWKKEAN